MGKKFKEKRNRKTSYNLEMICLSIIRWGTYLALFTPLIVHSSFTSPFIVPKTIFFRIIVDIIFIAYILLAIISPRYRPKFNALTLALSLFLGVFILTFFTGISSERLFLGDFLRMTGPLTFLHLFAFFIILISVFKERRDWERILTCSILAGVLFVLYILLSDQFSIKEGGTIGNSSFMGTYLLFDIFFALILFLIKSGKWRIFYGVTFLILLPVLLASTARGAIVSFFFGLCLLGFGYLMFFQKRLLRKFILAGVLFLIILGSASFIFQPKFIKNKINAILETPTLQARFIVWQVSWQSWKERFWLGWGPENSAVPLINNVDPRLILGEHGGEFRFDRAHNIILDTGLTSGLLGVLSYLSVFIIAIFWLLRICQKEKAGNNEVILSFGIISLLISYFLQDLLIFDTISSYILLFLTLALVSHISRGKGLKEGELIKKPISPLLKILGAILIITAVATIYFGNVQQARAAWYDHQALISPLEKAIPLYQKALRISSTSQWLISAELTQRVIEDISYRTEDIGILEQGFQFAEAEIKKSLKKNPLVFHLYLFEGRLYNRFSDLILVSKLEDKFNVNEKLELAEITLQKAIELSPKHPEGYWELAQTKMLQGKYEEAFNLYQKVINLEPHLAYSHWLLVLAYKDAGRNELAQEKIMEIKKANLSWKAKLPDLRWIIKVYEKWWGEDYPTLVYLYQEGLKYNPKAPQFWFGLAKTYAKLGEQEKAKEAAEKAREFALITAPEFIPPEIIPKIERFLESLKK
jgi:O-antigen ligase